MARAQSTNGSKSDYEPGDLADQMDAIRKDLQGLTETLADLSKAKVADAEALAKAGTETAKEIVDQTAQELKQRADAAHVQANDFIARQPATALAIAAGAGFLFGFLSSRR